MQTFLAPNMYKMLIKHNNKIKLTPNQMLQPENNTQGSLLIASAPQKHIRHM